MAIDNGSTAAELARATAQHLVRDGHQILQKGLRADAVGSLMALSRTGVQSRLKGLGLPASNEGLLRNLVTTWLDPQRTGATERLAEQLLAGITDADPAETIRLLCTAYVDEVQKSDIAEVQIALWAARSDADVTAGLRTLYDHLDRIVADLVDGLLAHWGRSMRPPLTSQDLATIVTAVVEGTLIRQRVFPESSTNELLGTLLLAILPTMTQHDKEKPRNFEAMVARCTHSHHPGELLSTNEMGRRVLDAIGAHVRSGAPCTELTATSVAEAIDVDVDVMELAIGPPERVAAEELTTVCQLEQLTRRPDTSAHRAVHRLVTERRDLVSFVLFCSADPNPDPVTTAAISGIGADLLAVDTVHSSIAGQVGSTILRAALDGADEDVLALLTTALQTTRQDAANNSSV